MFPRERKRVNEFARAAQTLMVKPRLVSGRNGFRVPGAAPIRPGSIDGDAPVSYIG